MENSMFNSEKIWIIFLKSLSILWPKQPIILMASIDQNLHHENSDDNYLILYRKYL